MHARLPTPRDAQVLTLSGWYADVLRRHEQLSAWTAGAVATPNSVWLPGLFNPKAFLTAVMQTYARARGLPLDVMRFVTDVTDKNPEQVGGQCGGEGGPLACCTRPRKAAFGLASRPRRG
jgi:dynein heavy chain